MCEPKWGTYGCGVWRWSSVGCMLWAVGVSCETVASLVLVGCMHDGVVAASATVAGLDATEVGCAQDAGKIENLV